MSVFCPRSLDNAWMASSVTVHVDLVFTSRYFNQDSPHSHCPGVTCARTASTIKCSSLGRVMVPEAFTGSIPTARVPARNFDCPSPSQLFILSLPSLQVPAWPQKSHKLTTLPPDKNRRLSHVQPSIMLQWSLCSRQESAFSLAQFKTPWDNTTPVLWASSLGQEEPLDSSVRPLVQTSPCSPH